MFEEPDKWHRSMKEGGRGRKTEYEVKEAAENETRKQIRKWRGRKE